MDGITLTLVFTLLLALTYVLLQFKIQKVIDQKFQKEYSEKLRIDMREFYREMESYAALFESRFEKFSQLVQTHKELVSRWGEITDTLKKTKKGKELSEIITRSLERDAKVIELVEMIKNKPVIEKSLADSINKFKETDFAKPSVSSDQAISVKSKQKNSRSKKNTPETKSTPKTLKTQRTKNTKNTKEQNQTIDPFLFESIISEIDEKGNIPSPTKTEELESTQFAQKLTDAAKNNPPLSPTLTHSQSTNQEQPIQKSFQKNTKPNKLISMLKSIGSGTEKFVKTMISPDAVSNYRKDESGQFISSHEPNTQPIETSQNKPVSTDSTSISENQLETLKKLIDQANALQNTKLATPQKDHAAPLKNFTPERKSAELPQKAEMESDAFAIPLQKSFESITKNIETEKKEKKKASTKVEALPSYYDRPEEKLFRSLHSKNEVERERALRNLMIKGFNIQNIAEASGLPVANVQSMVNFYNFHEMEP